MINFRVDIDFGMESASNVSLGASGYNRLSAFKGGNTQNSVLNNQNTNYKRFILGKSILGTNGLYSGEYQGLYGNVGSGNVLYDANDSSKGYKINNADEKYTITLSGENISYFKLVFDEIENNYATVFAINGNLHYNNSNEFIYNGEPLDNITLDILALKDSNVPVMINSISFTMYGVVSYTKNSGLLSLTRGSQLTADNVIPQFSIISQYGSIKLLDYNDVIYDLIKQNKLNKELVIKIYNNNIIIGTYESSKEWDYNVYNKEVNIDLQDKLLNLQEKTIEKKDIEYNSTAWQIYNYLKTQTTGFTWELDTELIDYLQTVTVPYFYLDGDTIWNQWNKFLQLTQCVMYSLPDGTIKIKRRV